MSSEWMCNKELTPPILRLAKQYFTIIWLWITIRNKCMCSCAKSALHLNTLGILGYCLISSASLMENWFTHYQHRAAQVTLSLGTRSPNHFLGSTAACRQGQPRQGTDTAPPAAAALCWAVLCPCAAVLCCAAAAAAPAGPVPLNAVQAT